MIRNWCCSFIMCSYETMFRLPSFCLVLWRWGWPVNDWNVFLLPLVYLWDCILQQGGGAGLSKLDIFCFELSKLFVNSSATDTVFVTVQAQQLKEQLRSAQVAGQWRKDTALTLPLFWRRSTVSPVFFGRYPWSSLHSVVPFPLCPRP